MAKIYNIDYFRHLRTPDCWNGITGKPPEGWVGTWTPQAPYGPLPLKARLKKMLKELSEIRTKQLLIRYRERKREDQLKSRDRQPEPNRSETLTDPSRDNHND